MSYIIHTHGFGSVLAKFKRKKIPYGENLGFGTKSCVNFQVLLYVGIDINSIDMQQAAKVTVNFVVLK